MSIGGPSPLGTLLIQRLDAVLGTTSGQQTNIVTGARPDAVSQSAQATRNQAIQNNTAKHPRETVDQITRQRQQHSNAHVRHGAQLDHRQSAIEALLRHTNTSATTSAPTTLGRAARTILEIIERFPDGSTPLKGQHPIVNKQRLHTLLTTAATLSPRATTNHAQQANTAPSTNIRVETTATQSPTSPVQQTGVDQLVQYLTQGLRNTIEQSGMFYESQLALFSFGKASISLSQLQQQPQNALPSELSNNSSSSQSEGKTTSNATLSSNPGSPSNTLTTHTDTEFAHQNIIRQQLEVLATQQLLWRGEVWAHTPFEWQIKREQEHEGSHNHKKTINSERWNSSLRMHLASLGDIEIKISMHDKQVSLQIKAPESAPTLQTHLPRLNERLSLQGLHIEHLSLDKVSAIDTTKTTANE